MKWSTTILLIVLYFFYASAKANEIDSSDQPHCAASANKLPLAISRYIAYCPDAGTPHCEKINHSLFHCSSTLSDDTVGTDNAVIDEEKNTSQTNDICYSSGLSLDSARHSFSSECANYSRLDCDLLDDGIWYCANVAVQLTDIATDIAADSVAQEMSDNSSSLSDGTIGSDNAADNTNLVDAEENTTQPETDTASVVTEESNTAQTNAICYASGSTIDSARHSFSSECANYSRLDCDLLDDGLWYCANVAVELADITTDTSTQVVSDNTAPSSENNETEALATAVGEPDSSEAEPVSVADSSGGWDNTSTPPALQDPITIELHTNSPTAHLVDFDNVGCEGKFHKIEIPSGRDALITMAEGSGPLIYPLWISGGRHAHILGLEVRPTVQPGCGVGEAHQINSSIPNIHPRMPGSKVFRVSQSGTTFFEGVNIELNGIESDCFVVRNSSNDFTSRHLYIVNSRCAGYESLDKTEIGDGIHGDFVQNQGENLDSLILENVTIRGSANGITIHAWHGDKTNLIRMRNLDYAWDERFSYDDNYEKFGAAFFVSTHIAEFENTWINDGRGYNFGFIDNERFGPTSDWGATITEGLFEGLPPFGEFAPAKTTGLNYVSPYLTK